MLLSLNAITSNFYRSVAVKYFDLHCIG